MTRRTVLLAPETFNLAETTRAIQVARALGDRHRCVVAGYSERYAGLVRDAGLEYRALQPRLTDRQADQLLRVDQMRGVRHPFDVPTVRARVASEVALIRELDAAAVVIGMTLTQLVSARAAGVPLVHVKPWAFSVPHLARLRHVPLSGGTTPAGRALDRAAARVTRAVAPHVTARPRAFDVVAREHGVRLPRPTVHALEADVNLLTSMTGFVEDVPLPPGYAHVGPVFARLGGALPDAVRSAVEASARPVVYLGLGSSADRRLVVRAVRALAAMPVTVVAPVGHYLDAPTRARLAAELGPHVLLTDLLPTHEVLPLVDAAVLHGGEGTVQAAVVQGVPFVGIGLQMEQRWNVDECVRHGAALAARPRDVGTPRLRARVAAVVRDPALRAGARRLQGLLHGVDGATRAADEIHRLVTSGRPRGEESTCTP
ncbi:nucleotide disphospho-sugar-binding domain-containing protein [Cellulomonas sp.]|uniref:glycosyltransferase n=1 Tax=Cellulomonas sp. TaxID=40001 RepID=UPI002811D894|nr:nucleotide disphospho-sugar-binding domain-containing protein [Cellulomonas sp.]